MRLLETQPQDIKLTRKFKACAPKSFRWIVVSGYLAILIGTICWGVTGVYAQGVVKLKEQQQSKNAGLQREISRERAQTLNSQKDKVDYDAFQGWLRQNHSMTQLLNVMFSYLPENARLRELNLSRTSGSRFNMVLKVFPVSDGSLISFEDFIAKLGGVGINLGEVAKSVGDGMEVSTSFTLPDRFFPAIASSRGLLSPTPIINENPMMQTDPVRESGDVEPSYRTRRARR